MIIFTENKKITIQLRLLFYNIIKCFPKTFMCIPIICRSDNIYLKYIFSRFGIYTLILFMISSTFNILHSKECPNACY